TAGSARDRGGSKRPGECGKLPAAIVLEPQRFHGGRDGSAAGAADQRGRGGGGGFDGDGDQDLFIGGRVAPGQYPNSPRSALLRNAGGRFEDATAELAPGLAEPGMVTAA